MTMKYWFGAVISLIAVAVLTLSCSSGTSRPVLGDAKLTILYSSNIGGIIEVCGCRPPLGGMAKRATIIDGVREEGGNLLVLDSGGMLYDRQHLYEPYDYINRANARTVYESMQIMKIDAVNVSAFDLADGIEALHAFDNERTPWVSANVVWKDSGEHAFTPDMIITTGDIAVGVFGIVTEKYRGIPLFGDDSPVKAIDPVETAKKEVQKLTPESHLIVALAYMDYDQAREIARTVPGINVMVVSHTGPHTPSSSPQNFHAFNEDGTIIVRCPDGGRVLGRLDIDIVDGALDFVENTQPIILMPDGSIKPPTRSQFRNRLYELDASIPRRADIQALVDETERMTLAYRDSLGIQ